MAALKDHVRLTREEPGCLFFEVTRDDASPTRFNVVEEFRDRAAFEYHQKRMIGSVWATVTKNVTRHYQVDELGFQHEGSRAGHAMKWGKLEDIEEYGLMADTNVSEGGPDERNG